MNTLNKTLLAVAIVAGSVLSSQFISPSFSGIAAAAVGDCGCGCATETAPCQSCVEHSTSGCETCVEAAPCTKKRGCGCQRCKRPRKKISCPSCAVECDTCTLKLDHYEEEKKCFKTEQKIVCIPPVRFPWEECCPPGRTNKTRTVNVLKVHKYKCKACGYKWKLDELPEPESPSEADKEKTPAKPEKPSDSPAKPSDSPESIDPVVAPVESQNLLTPPADAPQPAFETPTIPEGKMFDAVPAAPRS